MPTLYFDKIHWNSPLGPEIHLEGDDGVYGDFLNWTHTNNLEFNNGTYTAEIVNPMNTKYEMITVKYRNNKNA